MAQGPPQEPTPDLPPVSFSAFSGLRNTVSPEALSPRELQVAVNIDIDDAGEIHRRRGQRLAMLGNFHSLWTSPSGLTFVVKDGIFSYVEPSWKLVQLQIVGDADLIYVEVGNTVFISSRVLSFKVMVTIVQGGIEGVSVAPWGKTSSPAYRPPTTDKGGTWWLSPVVAPSEDLGSVGGRLMGAPPLASALAYFNGRIYLAVGSTLWATELFAYDYVDRTKGFRQFPSPITAIGAVEDGVYVGTQTGLYFLSGTFNEHVRTLREQSGVVPGSMVAVPAEMIDPVGRTNPTQPLATALALACMTNAGMVACFASGRTVNLTRAQFLFPKAVKAVTMFREQDGMNTVVSALDSGGTPTDAARFGDYLEATLIRANGTVERDNG